MSDTDFDRLVAEAETAVMQGWDWSALDGRYTEGPTPWDYRAAISALLPGAGALLDMGTGGGEFLSELTPLPPETWATEAWAPNIPVAEAKLTPLGVRVVAVEDDNRLPLPDAHFDLVINRHESFAPSELRRILRPGGVFVTQQVGGRDNVELNEALQDPGSFGYEDWTAEAAAAGLREAGLAVLEIHEALIPGHFADIGAVVMYLQFVPWQIEGFSVATHRERLLALHRRMQAEGALTTHIHRFFIVARRPADL